MNRRELLEGLARLFWVFITKNAWADGLPAMEKARISQEMEAGKEHRSNFKVIYGESRLRSEFLNFLKNVYHIYPESDFDRLIGRIASSHFNDRDIYIAVQQALPEIKPLLQPLTFALPALETQKTEMARQTSELLGNSKNHKGYMEIGTPGRYVLALQRHIKMSGHVYVVHTQAPGFSPEDIVERGQLGRLGNFVPLADYNPISVPEGSFDLVSNFIGLHHAPREKLDGFVQSIWKALKPGGKFILRDHDAASPQTEAMVALAHDVFNCGLGVPWEKNAQELRFFKSISYLEDYLAKQGFKRVGPQLAQEGDPTKNLLMAFEKTEVTATGASSS